MTTRKRKPQARGLAIGTASLYREAARKDIGRMKRIVWIFAATLLAAVALFALLIVLLPRQTLKTRIGEQIAAWTGRDVSLRGEPTFSFFPALSVTLNDVRVSGPADMSDAEIVSMDRLTGTIRLLPLIVGRVEIGSFTMERPLIRLVRDEEGARNWAFDSGAAALQLAFAGDVPLGEFRLDDGTVQYEDRLAQVSERLDSVDLSVEWTSVRQPLVVAGSGIWRGEQVSFSGGAEAPFAFLNGGATPVEARIESAPLGMIFDGEASEYPRPRLAGALKMSTPSLRGFAAWMGSPVGPGSTLGPASIFGTAVFKDRALSVENAEVTLDGNGASGALRIVATTRPEVAGTLAFGALDLTPYFAGLSTSLRTTDDWREVKFETGWFGDLQADVRLSAGAVRIGEIRTGDTAASVSLRDSRLEIGLARAVVNGGGLTGGLTIVHKRDGPATWEAQLRAKDLALATSAPLAGLPPDVSGTASLTFEGASEGSSLGELMRGLGGTARLEIANGAVPLFGLPDIATAGAPPEPPANGGFESAPVDRLSAGLSFGGGVAILERASLATPTFSADMQGWIGLLDGSLGLNGTVTQGAPGSQTAAAVPFTVDGSLARPVARPVALAN